MLASDQQTVTLRPQVMDHIRNGKDGHQKGRDLTDEVQHRVAGQHPPAERQLGLQVFAQFASCYRTSRNPHFDGPAFRHPNPNVRGDGLTVDCLKN